MTRAAFDALMKDASATTQASGKRAIAESYENRTTPQLPDTQQCKRPPELARYSPGEAQSPGCPAVSFLLRRVRLLDVDARYASVKDLLDGLAIAGAIPGDKEGQITLEVRQEKVGSYTEEETVITIEYPPEDARQS